jgi:putative ABC transport system substrate-binding protein
MAIQIRRRDFITLLGGAAVAWPLAARAQQAAMPVIGLLDSRSSDAMAGRLAGFRQGLKEVGFADGENVRIVYRWAENQLDRLPEMAADLIRQQAAVIFTTGGPASAFAAKAATTTIPVVFLVGEDPARLGLVSNLARPTGNLTGFNLFIVELEAKRLELLHQLVPGAVRIAVLVNPANVSQTEATLREVEAAARTIGVQTQVLKANTAREIEQVSATIGQERPDALFVGASAFLNIRRVQLVQLAAFHRLPATYALREAAEAGGLMSYGSSIVDAYRQSAIYAGRILKGAKPADLPVMQASKFELVINLATARLLGLTAPPTLLATADEVIE